MTFNLPFEQINAAQLETLKANAIQEARQLDYKEILPGNSKEDIRADILAGLIADKGGERQIGTGERILAEIISSDVALLVTFNQAIDGVLKNNQKAWQNPKVLAQLDGYKRGLVNSLTGNLQRFGFGKTAKVETLQEIIDEMVEGPGNGDDSAPAANGL